MLAGCQVPSPSPFYLPLLLPPLMLPLLFLLPSPFCCSHCRRRCRYCGLYPRCCILTCSAVLLAAFAQLFRPHTVPVPRLPVRGAFAAAATTTAATSSTSAKPFTIANAPPRPTGCRYGAV